MTLPRPHALAAALCAASLIPPAGAETPPAARAAIQTAYSQINNDYAQGDTAGVLAFFAPDYTSVDQKGETHSRDEMRRQYEAQRRQIKTIHSHWTFQNFTPQPNGTLVEMTMHTDGDGEKRVLFARLHGTFTNDLHVRDLWVETPQGWRIKHRQTLQDDTHTHPG